MASNTLYRIKQSLFKATSQSKFMRNFYRSLKYAVARTMGLLGDKNYAQWFHKLYTGKALDLDNPKTFDEKLWWLKLNNRDPLTTLCSDKHAVRDYVRKAGFGDILIEYAAEWETAESIDFSSIDYPVIIKLTGGSGLNYYLDPTDLDIDHENIRREFRKGLRRNPYVLSKEWNYKNIVPMIVAERAMMMPDGSYPTDYRFMCFDGEPKLLLVDIGRMQKGQNISTDFYRNVYDMDYKLLPIEISHPSLDNGSAKPKNFERMVEIARKLSQPFVHCRVDMYNIDGVIWFGEITFFHAGGCNNIAPEEWDLKMGGWIDVTSSKIVRKKA